MRARIGSCIAIVAACALTAPRAADVCITFADSVDNFEGEVVAAGNGHYTLAMRETLFNRAAYGTAVVRGDEVFLGWTKNTNTAAVHYQCTVDALSMSGFCAIHLFTSSPFASSRFDDFGFVETGDCGADARRTGTPPGEPAEETR